MTIAARSAGVPAVRASPARCASGRKMASTISAIGSSDWRRGGMMLPVLTTLLVQTADGRSLGRITPLVTFPGLLGPILGPFVGLIVQHLSLRWIFWLSVSFCVVGLILAWRLM